jgi:hypothetical protein
MNTLAIDQLNTEEKILTMEQLWDDLCHHAESIRTPEWHRTVLKERMELVKSGQAEYSDWSSAKRRIRAAVS